VRVIAERRCILANGLALIIFHRLRGSTSSMLRFG
jgi:hypothetical protein